MKRKIKKEHPFFEGEMKIVTNIRTKDIAEIAPESFKDFFDKVGCFFSLIDCHAK